MRKRDPWDFSDRMDGHIDGSANYNLLKEQQEVLQRERDDANKIAAAAKFQNERLVAEIHELRAEVNDWKERYAHLRNHSVLTEEHELLHEALHKTGICPLVDCMRWQESKS